MGDRVSISFVKVEKGKVTEESVALFHHWGGQDFPKFAQEYIKGLLKDNPTGKDQRHCYPLERREPSIVMVDFIRHLIVTDKQTESIKSSIYLGKDRNDGDNSDNGHFQIDVDTGKFEEIKV
jgi:hypothetical protein